MLHAMHLAPFFYVIKNKIVHYFTYIVCTAYNIHTYILQGVYTKACTLWAI